MVENNMVENDKISYTKKYIYYSACIFGLMNLVDIFSSNAGPLTVSNVVTEFLVIGQGMDPTAALALHQSLGSLSVVVMLLALTLKFVADRYGRKKALIINILGMTLGSVIVLISQNYWVFFIGNTISSFFLTADLQMLYITEQAPEDQRSRYIAFARIVGLVGAMLVPLMRGIYMSGDNPNWRALYVLPVILGVIVSLTVVFTIKESNVYLTMQKQRAANPELSQKKENFFKTIKESTKTKNFKLIMLVYFLGFLGLVGGMVERGFIEPYMTWGLGYTNEQINLIFYIRYGISIGVGAVIGYVRDKFGRKIGFLVTLITTPLFMVLFIITAKAGIIWLAGLFYGIYIYSLWMNPTTGLLIIQELTPTKYRASIGILWGIIQTVLYLILTIVLGQLFGAGVGFETLFYYSTIPTCLVAIPLLLKFVPETKDTDLTAIEA